MKTTKTSSRVQGMEDLSAVLKGLPKEIRAEILATAVGRAAIPVVRSAKKHALKSKRTGALLRSIGHVVRRYNSGGTAVAVVGPRKGYYREGALLGKNADRRGADMPTKYAHLIEFGHHTAAKSGESPQALAARTKGKSGRTKNFTASAFVLAQPFLRPALAETATQVRAAMAQGISEGIEKTRKRLVREGKHKV